jgi:hypothetical protein
MYIVNSHVNVKGYLTVSFISFICLIIYVYFFTFVTDT